MGGSRGAWLTAALLVAVGSGAAACGANPANDFCSSYANALHEIVVAARAYEADPDGFASSYKSTMDGLGKIRSKAPDDQLRTAFDKSMFTFSVFDSQKALAEFIGRADFSANAVVVTCAEYGVDVKF